MPDYNQISDDYKETEWVTCPDCNGKKGELINDDANDGELIWFKCETCRGDGEIEAEEFDKMDLDLED